MKELARLQAALAEVWPDLPGLLGDKAETFQSQLLSLLRAFEAEPFDTERQNAIYTFLESFDTVYDRLLESMGAGGDDFRGTPLATRPAVGRYLTMPVWFATDRQRTGSAAPSGLFGADRGPLAFGRVEVSIPDTHEKGKLEKPRLLRLEFSDDPGKHIVLRGITELDTPAWKQELTDGLDKCPSRDVLLFIHGYNVDFAQAALRAAQFAFDLEFQGACVLYSWPSEAATVKYTIDEDNALWTVDHFEQVLTMVMTELGAARVHAVAHSMGSRVLAEGLRRVDVAALPAGRAALRDVVFAAPDINADTFRTFIEKFRTRADRFTLYASSGDKALGASQRLHKYPRAGDAGDGIVIAEGLETIDASAVDVDLMGHSYFCENRVIIQDLFNLIMKGEGSATPRFGLTAKAVSYGTYWVMGR